MRRGKFGGLIVVAGKAAWGVCAQGQDRWRPSPYGHWAIFQMEHAPYPHETREQGFVVGDRAFPKDPHYNDSSVRIVIPEGYKPMKNETDLLFYFHGHLADVRDYRDFDGRPIEVERLVHESGRRPVMVFPQGPRNVPDSGCGKLEEAGGFERLVEEVLATLKRERKIRSTKPGSITLAGHSGGYRVIAAILQAGGLQEHITDVYVLDATYGRLDVFARWAARDGRRRLRSIFTDPLASANQDLAARLRDEGVPFALANADSIEPHTFQSRALLVHAPQLDHFQVIAWLTTFLREGGDRGR